MILRMLGTLNEAQARWYVATEAISYGYGGVKEMHRLTGMSPTTIIKGIKEVSSRKKLGYEGRVRKPGGGRKSLEQKDSKLSASLHRILDENTSGDPMTWLKWTTKSEHKIAGLLNRSGHNISYRTVGRMLHALDYSLQSNKKNIEGRSPPERDAQFRYINKSITGFIAKNQPVISVDTKKKELVGNFRNQGRIWRRKGEPREVNVYDFKYLGKGKAIPYGTYDIAQNKGFVNVGISSDTSEFAVESIRQWWLQLGRKYYTGCRELLICADSGGSNGRNRRGWKYYLQLFATETGLKITVCHLPPGTSKWNRIEHKLFSFISINWKGEPLTSYEVVINFIRATTTSKGLEVFARLDRKRYRRGRKFTDEDMKTVKLHPHRKHPDWNYTIIP
jgi:hypothetical protein